MSTDAVNTIATVVEAKKKGKAVSKKAQAEASPSATVDVNVEALSLEEKVEKLTELVNSLVKRIEVLEARPSTANVDPVNTKGVGKKEKEPKEDKKPRAPSAYNLFMKEKMGELKDSHPELNNIERMKMAAEMWSASKPATTEN
jgi:hypothetical protein